MFRKENKNILVQHSEEMGHCAMRKTLRIVCVLIWLSGAVLLVTGVYLIVSLSSANYWLNFSVLYTVNILLVVSGSIAVVFATLGCFDYFIRRRITLCAMTYLVTLLFVLHCILSALAFTWRKEGCAGASQGSCETSFLIVGVVSVFTGVCQFVCFHVANYLISRRE